MLVERLKDGQAESLCRLIRDLNAFQQVHSLNDNDQNSHETVAGRSAG